MIEEEIVCSSPVGFFVFELNKDKDFLLKYFNPIAEKLVSIDLSQYIGKNIQEIFPNLKNAKLIKQLLWVANGGGIWQNEKFVYPINNIQRVFNLTAYNIKNGLIAIMFQD
ncbi:MAG: PAS domain-containing protein, partial [Candidatus Heimdallarchaeota archaeon]